MVKLKKLIILLFFVAALPSCEYVAGSDPQRSFYYESSTSLKLISPEIEDPKDTDSFNQEFYPLDSNYRLLIKSDDLGSKMDGLPISTGFVMALNIYIDNEELSEGDLEKIKLCPLSQNWMVLATWNKYYPSSKASWKSPGGDFNLSSCFSVAKYNSSDDILNPIPDSKSNNSTDETVEYSYDKKLMENTAVKMQFDITRWYQNTVAGSISRNYGFVLISETPLVVFGDRSNYKPMTSWSDLK